MHAAVKYIVGTLFVLAFMIWYVTQQQHVQADEMKVDSTKFDEQFDRAWAKGPKADWEADAKEAKAEHIAAKEKAKKSREAEDATFKEMGDALEADAPKQ